MGDISPQWYFRLQKVEPEARGIGALAYREYDTSGHVILISLWFYTFVAERVCPMRRTMRL